jgi:hypothetical protein
MRESFHVPARRGIDKNLHNRPRDVFRYVFAMDSPYATRAYDAEF